MVQTFRVSENEAVVIERWDGKYLRTESRPGLHMKEPDLFSKIVARISTDIFEEAFDVKVQTNDQVYATVPVKLQMRIEDPRSYHYNADKPMDLSRSIIVDSLKKLCNMYSLQELRGKAILQPSLQLQIGEQVQSLYGIKIVKALIGMADPGQEILDATHQVIVNAKQAEAELHLARARSVAETMMAEARNASLRAEIDVTVSKFRELVDAGIPEKIAAEFLQASVRSETLRRIARDGSVFVSDEQGRFVNSGSGIPAAAAMAVPHGLAPLALPLGAPAQAAAAAAPAVPPQPLASSAPVAPAASPAAASGPTAPA